MAEFIEFLGQQWMLVGGLVACLFLLLQHESRKGGEALSPQQLINRVNQKEAVVVDLRDSADFQQGHIVDALNIPAAKLVDRAAELEPFRGRPLVLVCKMGQHAGAAGKTLATKGFDDVSRLQGGMMEWSNMQLPLVKS